MRRRIADALILGGLLLVVAGAAGALAWVAARLGMPPVIEVFVQVCICGMVGSMLAGPWRHRPDSEAQVRAALREERSRRCA